MAGNTEVDERDRVRGMGEATKMAAAGLKLFKEDEVAELDAEGATKFKEELDAKMLELDAEAAALTGKDNKKARQEKEKQKSAMKVQKDYIDACKVVKGLQPVNGFFCKKAEKKEAVQAAASIPEEAEDGDDKKAKKDKPKKAQESAGISREEKDELERLKSNIIEKKKALKEGGMSGGQMNKDEEIVAWVARMNELKEKENPGGLASAKDDKKGGKKKKLDSESQAHLDEKERFYEEYLEKLRTEFKYTKKEIAADPDAKDMKAEIDKMKKGS